MSRRHAPRTIRCRSHGVRPWAIVCMHIGHGGKGFKEQEGQGIKAAICDDCETLLNRLLENPAEDPGLRRFKTLYRPCCLDCWYQARATARAKPAEVQS